MACGSPRAVIPAAGGRPSRRGPPTNGAAGGVGGAHAPPALPAQIPNLDDLNLGAGKETGNSGKEADDTGRRRATRRERRRKHNGGKSRHRGTRQRQGHRLKGGHRHRLKGGHRLEEHRLGGMVGPRSEWFWTLTGTWSLLWGEKYINQAHGHITIYGIGGQGDYDGTGRSETG